MTKIHADMTIKEILEIKPEARQILLDYGLTCAGCELGDFETLEEGAAGHGLTENEVQEMVNLINSN